MHAEQKKVYALFITATIGGWLWLLYHLYLNTGNASTTVCLVKSITGMACPSCGSTRSIIAALQGNWKSAFIYFNPMGLIVLLLMTIVPIWMLIDLISKKETFWVQYKKAEQTLQKKAVAIPLIVLVLINWIWNIYKHL